MVIARRELNRAARAAGSGDGAEAQGDGKPAGNGSAEPAKAAS
jgi:hypothetical protein